MSKKQAVKLVAPNFDRITNIKPFLEKEFLRKVIKNTTIIFFMKIFYYVYIVKFRKLRVLFKFLKILNLNFKIIKAKILLYLIAQALAL